MTTNCVLLAIADSGSAFRTPVSARPTVLQVTLSMVQLRPASGNPVNCECRHLRKQRHLL
jgi:hypothetical protein